MVSIEIFSLYLNPEIWRKLSENSDHHTLQSSMSRSHELFIVFTQVSPPMWNCGLWSSPRQMNSSRFQEQWSWKVTLLVSFILVFQQILQGESWFIVTELLFSFQRPWWRVICQNFKQVHHFFLSRMATVSKDGTWKIWDIDGEFIWHYNF